MSYGAEYFWDFGDGETSTEENPSHVYAAGGIYTVTLSVTIDGEIVTKTRVDYITVADPIYPLFTFHTEQADMLYFSNYQSSGLGAMTAVGGLMKQDDGAADATYPTTLSCVVPTDSQFKQTFRTTATGFQNRCIEIEIGSGLPAVQVGSTAFVGIWANGPGGWDANWNYGKNLQPTYYQRGGTIGAYAGTSANGATWAAGDRLGIVVGTSGLNYRTRFYKNGVLQGDTYVSAAFSGYAISFSAGILTFS